MSCFFANGNGVVRLNMTPKEQAPELEDPILLPVVKRWVEDGRYRKAVFSNRKEKPNVL